MKMRLAFRLVSPYLAGIGVVGLVAMLLATMYFTWFTLEWTTFLSGILIAAVISLVTRASRAEWILARRTAQLSSMRGKLSRETALSTQLHESELRFRSLTELSSDGYWEQDENLRFTYVSNGIPQKLGYAADATIGKRLWELTDNTPLSCTGVEHQAALVRREPFRDFELSRLGQDLAMQYISISGTPVFGDDGSFRGYRGVVRDISERKRAEQKLTYHAQFDTLTGLPNRHLLRDRLEHVLTQTQRNSWRVGAMFIDLDHFKNVNDSFGHSVGDKLLVQVAKRLRQAVRDSDTVGRLGGDEFAVVLPNLIRGENVGLVAQKLIAALSAPFDLDGRETYIAASIGIAVHPDDGGDADELLKNADTAMYRAKEQGRGNYQFYLPQMQERAAQRLRLETSLRGALERREFVLHYQPKVELSDGAICGLEALIRWQSAERGLVPPIEFIPALEDTGLIVPVGEWVLRVVCEQIKAWQSQGVTPPRVAINVSARQFRKENLESFIACIRQAGIDPALIEIELTESLLMKDVGEAVRTLTSLKDSGVHLSVDDFGTGYSSLAYLKRFPLDTLKIDRTFIRDAITDPDDAAITLAIISLAHSLKLKVVAEGVETEAQLDFLRMHGCDEMQGYYFARPMTIEDCTRMLREDVHMTIPSPVSSQAALPLLVVSNAQRQAKVEPRPS